MISLNRKRSTPSCDSLFDYANFESFNFSLTRQEIDQLRGLKVPQAKEEVLRLRAVKQSNLIDNLLPEDDYDRYTSLGARIFNVRPITIVYCIC